VLGKLKTTLPPSTIPNDWKYVHTPTGEPVLEIPKDQTVRSFSYTDSADADTPGDAVIAAKQLAVVFHHSRTRVVESSGAGKRVPAGADIDFDVTLDGLKGRLVTIRWTLFRARDGKPVPRDWLRYRKVLAVTPKRASEPENREFWVPLPKRHGPYFVRLVVVGDGGPVRHQDSDPFS
jgi:hypothetical protein